MVRVQAYKLADGQHLARLRFDSDTIGDSAIIPVTVNVVNRQAYFDIDGNGTAGSADCQAIQTKIGLRFGEPGYDLTFDVDRDGTIENEDVGTCQTAVSPTLPGDFDRDGDVDDHDIDLLLVEIAAGTHQGRFDLTGDSLVNAADSTRLVEGILHTHIGDANLDRFVNRADAAIVATNLGWAGGAAWARGNFNSDARVDLVDVAIQQSNFGRGPAPSPGAASPSAPEAVVATDTLFGFQCGQRRVASPMIHASRRTTSLAQSGLESSSENKVRGATSDVAHLARKRRSRNVNRSSRELTPSLVDNLFTQTK